MVIYYFLFYILSNVGYFLGKVTKEEHKEIENLAILIAKVLAYFTLGIVIAVVWEIWIMVLFAIALVFYMNKYFERGLVFLYALTFIVLMGHEQLWFVIALPVIVLSIVKSFKKYETNECLLEILILVGMSVYFLL